MKNSEKCIESRIKDSEKCRERKPDRERRLERTGIFLFNLGMPDHCPVINPRRSLGFTDNFVSACLNSKGLFFFGREHYDPYLFIFKLTNVVQLILELCSPRHAQSHRSEKEDCADSAELARRSPSRILMTLPRLTPIPLLPLLS